MTKHKILGQHGSGAVEKENHFYLKEDGLGGVQLMVTQDPANRTGSYSIVTLTPGKSIRRSRDVNSKFDLPTDSRGYVLMQDRE